VSLAPPQNSFRAIYRTTFRTPSVVVTCEGDHIVIRDAETEQETERFMPETMRLEELPDGLFLEAGTARAFRSSQTTRLAGGRQPGQSKNG
jgi:hypothetical protein